MTYIGSYYDPDKKEKPKDYNPEKKYFYVLSYSYAQLYVEKSDAEKAKFSRTNAEKEAAEAARKERIAGLKEIKSHMEKRRDDFILNFKNFPGGKTFLVERYNKIISIIFDEYCGGKLDTMPHMMYDLMGVEINNYSYEKSCEALILETIKQGFIVAKKFAFMAYAMLDTRDGTWYIDGDYNDCYNGKYAILYEFLEICGYEISDEERAFIDGTHELYTKGD